MKKQFIPIFFLMTWLWGLTACRPVPISPTLTPAPTPDATRQLLAEELSPPGYSGLAAWGGMVYFGYGNAFYWLDVHDPAHPTLQGNLPLPNRLSRISLQDGEAHLILSTPDGFDSPVLADGWQRVDLTTPARPQLTTFFDSPISLYQVVLYRDTAYLMGHNELLVVDVSDAAAPRTLASYSDFAGSLRAIVLMEPYLLVSAANCFRSCSSTLYVLDLTNPQQPQTIGSYSHYYGAYPTLLVHAPYVTMVGSTILNIELTNPEHPYPIGELNTRDYYFEAAMVDGWLFTAPLQGVTMFDMRWPEHPFLRHQLDETLSVSAVAVDGDLLAVLDREEGVILYSVADIFAPQELARFQLPEGLTSIR